ncbi:hypothetical protein [Streptomyces nondiastaticus]|uniref:Uncharacterized protein n=1 Tax=Streptomyces nondiastaticus TaxID=3154512 RepID=A0ABW6U9X5_9ACTN
MKRQRALGAHHCLLAALTARCSHPWDEKETTVTYTCRTTGGTRTRGGWLGPMLGWVWALGAIAAAGNLAAVVHHDLSRTGQTALLMPQDAMVGGR